MLRYYESIILLDELYVIDVKDLAMSCHAMTFDRCWFMICQGNEHGVREMTAAIREHAGKNGKDRKHLDWKTSLGTTQRSVFERLGQSVKDMS